MLPSQCSMCQTQISTRSCQSPGNLNLAICESCGIKTTYIIGSMALSQVNGKLRGTVEVAKDIAQEEAEVLGRKQESVAKFLNGKVVKKKIFIPGRILNFIVGK